MWIYWRSCCSSWTKLKRTPTRRALVGKTVRNSIDGTWLGKSTNWECLFVHRKQKLFLSVYVDDIKMGLKAAEFSSYVEEMDDKRWCWGANIISWSRLFRKHSNGSANQTRKHWTIQQSVWVPYFCRSNREITRMGQTSRKKLQRGPTIWKDMLENALNGIANWQTRRQSNYTTFPVLVWTITKFKKEELENKGELSEICSHVVLKCLYLARIGRPDIQWSVNKLARSITKWTQACDERLSRLISWLISYINFTSDYRQYCHVGNAAQHCRLGLFQDLDFCRWSWRLKINIRRSFCAFWKSNICADQFDVQEADVGISQLHRIRNHLAGYWFAYGWFTCARLMGFGHWSAENDLRNTKTNPSEHTGNRCSTPKHTQD